MSNIKKTIINNFLKKVLVLDTESTGIDAKTAEICEIGVTSLIDNKVFTEDQLFGTEYPIPFAATSKNNITRRMLDGLPTFKTAINDVIAMLNINNKNIQYYVAHNYNYDRTILLQNFVDGNGYAIMDYKIQNSFLCKNWICTYRLAKHLFPQTEENAELSYALNYLRYAFDLPVSDEKTVHRAGDDSLVTWFLLEFIVEYLLEQMDEEDLTEDLDLGTILFELSKSPIIYTTMPFGKHKGEKLKDVPDSYYKWMLEKSNILDEKNDNYDPDLAASIEEELNRRMEN